MLLAIELYVIFIVIGRRFDLTARRAAAPFGAYLAISALIVAFLFLALRPHMLEAFVIPTKSMSPTMNPGDRFVVNKLLRPRRLDLVAYWTYGPHRDVYIKRLIGLPGERLRFENGGLYVNDHPIELPNVLAGHCRAALGPPPFWPYHDGQTITLGPDEYFFIGDNADISLDSRHAGPSHGSALAGVVDLIYWPVSRFHVVR